MPKYRLFFNTGATASATVEAESLDEAIDEAHEVIPREVCAQCSGWGQDWSLDLGDFEFDEDEHFVDGTAVNSSKHN